VEFSISDLNLLPGVYHLSVSIYNRDINESFDHQNRMYEFQIENKGCKEQYGIVYFRHNWQKIK